MRDREPTVRSRELGDALRAAMQRAGLAGKDVAKALDWSQPRVSRLLNGKRGGSEVDVASFMVACRVGAAERDRLLRLVKEMNRPGLLHQHGSRLPKQLRTLIAHEERAVKISDFQSTLVPGLLQTGDYARALSLGAGMLPDDEIDGRVQARLARQALFSGTRPPHCTFFVHEFALRLPVGSATVMSDQLHALLRMSVRNYISLRVVPAALGPHAAIAGSFTLLEFDEIRPVVYLENQTSELFLEEKVETSTYRRIGERLGDTALPEGQSRDLITNVVVEQYADREDP